MFIYKITIITTNQVYIGFDSKSSWKMSRWKEHIKNANESAKYKLHKEMFKHGIENCKCDIIHDNVQTLVELACLEIQYIKEYNSYKNGLNSSPGGDGLGKHDLYSMTEYEISTIKNALSERMTNYNNDVKWTNTSSSDRSDIVNSTRLFSREVSEQRSQSLKNYYKHNPDACDKKLQCINEWRLQNPELLKEQNIRASAIAAVVNNKKIKVEFPDGTMKIYKSRTQFKQDTGRDATYILKKTASGSSCKGFRAWDV